MSDVTINLLKKHEGCRLKPYNDSLGYSTIGYGRCLDKKGISQAEAESMLENDIEAHVAALSCYPFWNQLNEARQAVMIDLRHNLGGGGLAGFVNFLGFMRAADYDSASTELLNSKWASQVGSRATEDALIIKTGATP